MIHVIAIFHVGIPAPSYACQFASLRSYDTNVMFLDAEVFADHAEQLNGVIDCSQGVAVLYRSEYHEWELIRDAVLRYIKKNRNKLIEEWWGYVHVKKGRDNKGTN